MIKTKLRFVFLVQGEGRGHMTQAIVMDKLLVSHGHEVAYTFIGKSERRKIPEYFIDQISSEVQPLLSPNFILDKNNKSLKLFSTIVHNVKYLKTYYKSMREIDRKINSLKPDILINFYDFLGGFYFLFFRPKLKHVVIGRQFLSGHPEFPFAKGSYVEKKLYMINNALTSIRAKKKIALSFRPYAPLKYKKVEVVPPLMRQEIKSLKVQKEDFILAYMVNDGYGEEIMEWHKDHRDQQVHVFWDRKGVPQVHKIHKNLIFHQIDNTKFVELMRRCKGYVSTAGFESICEAMYLGKPALMIPVASQFEQACNGIDAEIAGAGITSSRFDLSKLIDYIPNYKPVSEEFQNWESQASKRILDALTIFD
jgi:uncharacterized protein (TIGR00661 family)